MVKNLEVWHFGKNKKQADKLFELVLQGEKTATSYLYNKDEKLTTESYSILTNWDKKKQILIQITNIEVIHLTR